MNVNLSCLHLISGKRDYFHLLKSDVIMLIVHDDS